MKQNELQRLDHMDRLYDLVEIYFRNAKMDDALIDLNLLSITLDEALTIVEADALYDLNFTAEQAEEFLNLLKEYKEELNNA
jgi:RNAse (barnase) inhibitor barstar